MLGILIGISAVVLTVGLGQGAQPTSGTRSTSSASNVLVVSPGSSTDTSGIRGGFGTASTLTVADAAALASEAAAPDITAVAAVATHLVLPDRRDDQLDDDRHRHDPVLAGGAQPRPGGRSLHRRPTT